MDHPLRAGPQVPEESPALGGSAAPVARWVPEGAPVPEAWTEPHRWGLWEPLPGARGAPGVPEVPGVRVAQAAAVGSPLAVRPQSGAPEAQEAQGVPAGRQRRPAR